MIKLLTTILLLITQLYSSAGGVANIQLWLRADHAASSSVWEDSVQGWDAEQSDGDKQPTPISNQANFNPIMRFDGTDDFMDVNYHDKLNGQNLTVFIVTKYTGENEECSSPWTTRYKFDMFFLTTERGTFYVYMIKNMSIGMEQVLVGTRRILE